MADGVEFDAEESDWSVASLAAIVTFTFLLFAYPGIGVIRAVLGQPGLAVSPLVVAPLMWIALVVFVKFEPRVQARPDWDRIENLWYGSIVTVGLVLPLVVALLWPIPVLNDLPRVLCATICVAALPVAILLIIARARLWTWWRERRD